MQVDPEDMTDVVHRLRRAQGQIGGVLRLIEDGADCIDVVTQLSAASKALDRAGFAIIATSLEKCLALGEEGEVDRERLRKAFLSLA